MWVEFSKHMSNNNNLHAGIAQAFLKKKHPQTPQVNHTWS